jgi:mono/diheme cytochrome c family protein
MARAPMIVAVATFCMTLAGIGAVAVAAAELEAGRDLAQTLCARCHLNEGQGEKTALGEIPGFRAIASRPDASQDRIVAWLRSLPEAMPSHRLTQDEMDSLAMFILSLRGQPRR